MANTRELGDFASYQASSHQEVTDKLNEWRKEYMIRILSYTRTYLGNDENGQPITSTTVLVNRKHKTHPPKKQTK